MKEFDNSLKRLFKTSLFIFIILILAKLFSYAYRIIIARSFGAEIYGLFSLAFMVLSWFAAVSAFGLPEGVLRFISLYRGEKSKLKYQKIKYVFKLSSLILIFSTIFFALLSFLLSNFIALNIFHEPGLIIFLKIFSFIIPFSVFSLFFFTIMDSFEKVKQQSFIMDFLQGFAKVFSLVILIYLGFNSAHSVIFSFFLGVFIIFLTAFLYCKYKIPQLFGKHNLKQKLRKKISSSLLSYSWPLMFFSVILSLFSWIDSFTIGYFKTATEVGFYNAAIPIAFFLTFTPQLFLQLLFPMITKEYSRKNFKLIKELAKQIGKWIFLINIPIFLLIIVFPDAAINILFGSEFLVASTALRLLLIGTLFSSVFIVSQNLISMVGKSKLILFNLIIASIVNIVLNIKLVPMQNILWLENSLGINGAAIATVLSIITFNTLLIIQANRYTKIIPIRRKMLRIFLISLLPFVVLLLLKKIVAINYLSIIILVGIFFSLYLILLFAFKALDQNDLMILKTVKHKITSLVR